MLKCEPVSSFCFLASTFSIGVCFPLLPRILLILKLIWIPSCFCSEFSVSYSSMSVPYPCEAHMVYAVATRYTTYTIKGLHYFFLFRWYMMQCITYVSCVKWNGIVWYLTNHDCKCLRSTSWIGKTKTQKLHAKKFANLHTLFYECVLGYATMKCNLIRLFCINLHRCPKVN